MNLDTLEWDSALLDTFNINVDVLPKIHTSSEVYGDVRDNSVLDGIPISGVSIFYFIFLSFFQILKHTLNCVYIKWILLTISKTSNHKLLE